MFDELHNSHNIMSSIRMSHEIHVLEIYKKRLLYLHVYTILSRDLIYNMNHMHISGTDPRQGSLAKQSSLKRLKVMTQKCLNKLKPKEMV